MEKIMHKKIKLSNQQITERRRIFYRAASQNYAKKKKKKKLCCRYSNSLYEPIKKKDSNECLFQLAIQLLLTYMAVP